jgi:hypothetical protein
MQSPTSRGSAGLVTSDDGIRPPPGDRSEFIPTFEVIRAEALFASPLQSSESPSPDQVRRAVGTTLCRLGIRGCTAQLAGEFGDHPDTAAARMTWALAMIRTVYPTPSMIPTPGLRLLARLKIAPESWTSTTADAATAPTTA